MTTRATVTIHTAHYTLGNGDGRTRPVELAVVSRQTRKGSGWRTTRQTVVDAGAATRWTAHALASQMAAGGDIVQRPEVAHGHLGAFNLAVDSERDAMLAAARGIVGTARVPVGVASDATGSAALDI